jgi:surface protein
MAFVFTIDTTQLGAGSTNNSGFALPLGSDGDYDFFIDWGDAGGEDNITVYSQPEVVHQYADTGIYQISITGIGLTGWQFNGIFDAPKMLNVSSWGQDVFTINKRASFQGCSNLTSNATDSPNLIGTATEAMFDGCSSLISGVSGFDLSQATTTLNMFRGSTNFNDDLSNWNMTGITSTNAMFSAATSFNNNGQTGIGNWDLSSVTNLNSTFYDADGFNQPIHTWVMPTSNCTAVSMFQNNGAFNNGGVSMSSWDTSNITSMQSMFLNANAFNVSVSGWDVSNVTTFQDMFYGTTLFNQNIQPWDVSSVTTALRMFYQADAFNNGGLPMTGMVWSSCSSFNQMFREANAFNQPVSGWDVSSATTLGSMFRMDFFTPSNFNQDISDWTMPSSNCTAISMFQNNQAFNNGGQSMSSWNVSGLTQIYSMFLNANAFNVPVSGWDVSNITSFQDMFYGTTLFNQNIQPWNVSNVTTALRMFYQADAFNNGGLPMTGMDWSSCSTFTQMFFEAFDFNAPVSGWDVSGPI